MAILNKIYQSQIPKEFVIFLFICVALKTIKKLSRTFW